MANLQNTPVSQWTREDCVDWAENVCRINNLDSTLLNVWAFRDYTGDQLASFTRATMSNVVGAVYGPDFHRALRQRLAAEGGNVGNDRGRAAGSGSGDGMFGYGSGGAHGSDDTGGYGGSQSCGSGSAFVSGGSAYGGGGGSVEAYGGGSMGSYGSGSIGAYESSSSGGNIGGGFYGASGLAGGSGDGGSSRNSGSGGILGSGGGDANIGDIFDGDDSNLFEGADLDKDLGDLLEGLDWDDDGLGRDDNNGGADINEELRPYRFAIARSWNENGRRMRGPISWEFLVRLLANPVSNPSLVMWEDRAARTIRLVQPGLIARLWGVRTGRPNLTYNNFARALRHQYGSSLVNIPERQLVYGLGPPAMVYLERVIRNPPDC